MITQEPVENLVSVVDQGLCAGLGKPIPGQMCVEAAVCYSMGLPHGDRPTCVLEEIRRLKIALNDKTWSSTTARARGLRRLAVAQLGSTRLDAKVFRKRVLDITLGRVLPRALRAAARVAVGDHPAKLEAAAVNCETKPTRESVRTACDAANAAAYDAAGTAYACYTAAAAAAVAAADAAADADKAAVRDKELATFAEEVVQVLVEMGTEGSQWLHLVPLEG